MSSTNTFMCDVQPAEGPGVPSSEEAFGSLTGCFSALFKRVAVYAEVVDKTTVSAVYTGLPTTRLFGHHPE